MADITIDRNDQGVYEQDIEAGKPTSVLLRDVAPYSSAVITVHAGDHPVYASRSKTDPKDAEATMIPSGGWAQYSIGGYSRTDATIWLVSEGDATVSVSRS